MSQGWLPQSPRADTWVKAVFELLQAGQTQAAHDLASGAAADGQLHHQLLAVLTTAELGRVAAAQERAARLAAQVASGPDGSKQDALRELFLLVLGRMRWLAGRVPQQEVHR